jgi:hypothetical protein
MASHPEQLRIQIEEAIASSIPYDDYRLIDGDIDLELLSVIQGKGSSHYIALFYTNGDISFIRDYLYDVRSEIMDGVATSITRKRVPNITFKVTDVSPDTFHTSPEPETN